MDAKTEAFREKYLAKLSPKVKTLYLIKEAKFINDGGAITVGKIVSLVIVCIVIAYILPIGLTALGAINTTGMSEGEQALLGVIGIIIVLVIFVAITKEAE